MTHTPSLARYLLKHLMRTSHLFLTVLFTVNARQFATSICSSTASLSVHGHVHQDTIHLLHWQLATSRRARSRTGTHLQRNRRTDRGKQSTTSRYHTLTTTTMSFTSVKAQRSATDAVASATAATVGVATVVRSTAVSSNLAPAVPSGFARRRNTVVGGLFGLAVLYHLVYNLVKDMVRIKTMLLSGLRERHVAAPCVCVCVCVII